MNSIVEAKVRGYLKDRLQRKSTDCGAIVFNMRSHAQAAGHGLDDGFGGAGLAVGPDARVASSIVGRALGSSGDAVTENLMNKTIDRWVATTPPMGQ